MVEHWAQFSSAAATAGTNAGGRAIKNFIESVGTFANGFFNGLTRNIIAQANNFFFALGFTHNLFCYLFMGV